jgi:hypothetical protein
MMKRTVFIVLVAVSALYDKSSAFYVSSISRCQNVRSDDTKLEAIFWWDCLPDSPKYTKRQEKSIAEVEDLKKFLEESKSFLDETNEALAWHKKEMERDMEIAMSMEEWSETPAIETPVAWSEWSEMTVTNIKAALKERDLKMTGKKVDLVARVYAYELELASAVDVAVEEESIQVEADTLADSATSSSSREPYSDTTVAELKMELRGKGLKVGGKKTDLIERLQSHTISSSSLTEEPASPADSVEAEQPVNNHHMIEVEIDYESRTVQELKKELRGKGLGVGGKKAELIKRLKTA